MKQGVQIKLKVYKRAKWKVSIFSSISFMKTWIIVERFYRASKTWHFTYLLLTLDWVRWESRSSRTFSDVPKWRLTRSVLVLDECTLCSLFPRQCIHKMNIISVKNYRYTHTVLIYISHKKTIIYYPLLSCEFIIY